MTQETGFLGKLVTKMIQRTVRARFRAVYWNRHESIPDQCIFVANHHGWHDGYVMFHLVKALNRPSLDWIQEYDTFPLFGKVGGMPFPADNPSRRAATLKRTIRIMRSEPRSLILFGEGILHRPPEVWEIGKSIELIAKQVPGVKVIPVAIHYDMSLHERPEVFIQLGEPIENQMELAKVVQCRLSELLSVLHKRVEKEPEGFVVLVHGTKDVNERWDMRQAPWNK